MYTQVCIQVKYWWHHCNWTWKRVSIALSHTIASLPKYTYVWSSKFNTFTFFLMRMRILMLHYAMTIVHTLKPPYIIIMRTALIIKETSIFRTFTVWPPKYIEHTSENKWRMGLKFCLSQFGSISKRSEDINL